MQLTVLFLILGVRKLLSIHFFAQLKLFLCFQELVEAFLFHVKCKGNTFTILLVSLQSIKLDLSHFCLLVFTSVDHVLRAFSLHGQIWFRYYWVFRFVLLVKFTIRHSFFLSLANLLVILWPDIWFRVSDYFVEKLEFRCKLTGFRLVLSAKLKFLSCVGWRKTTTSWAKFIKWHPFFKSFDHSTLILFF